MQELTEMPITPAEWDVMRIVWTVPGSTSREINDYLLTKHDWTESTVKTLLRRLVAKRLLEASPGEGRSFTYEALIGEQDTMRGAGFELFTNLCAMKRGGTLVDLVDKLELSRSDLEKLQAVVARKIVDAPAVVSCNCLGPATIDCESEGGEN